MDFFHGESKHLMPSIKPSLSIIQKRNITKQYSSLLDNTYAILLLDLPSANSAVSPWLTRLSSLRKQSHNQNCLNQVSLMNVLN